MAAMSAQNPVLFVTEELSCQVCRYHGEHLFRCEGCHINMCTKCKNEHLKKTRGPHNILTIYRKVDGMDSFCKYHNDQKAIYFCIKCQVFICNYCYKKHSSHDCQKLEQVIEIMRRKMAGIIGEIEKIDIPRLNSDIESLKQMREKQRERYYENFQRIDQQIENLKSVLSSIGEDMKQFFREQQSNADQQFEELEQIVEQRLQNAKILVNKGKSVLKSNSPAGKIIDQTLVMETESKTLVQNLIIPKYHDFLPAEMEDDSSRKHLKSLIGKVTPKVEIKRTFYRKESNIENLCPSRESSKVWIHQTDEKKIELVDSDGKRRKEIKLRFVPNEVMTVSRNMMLFSSPEKCCIYSLSEDGHAKEFANFSPCKPLGMTVTKGGDVMVCVVEDWTFDITLGKRCVCVLDIAGRTQREIEFDKQGNRLFTLPHSVTQNIDETICVLDASSESDGRVCFFNSHGKLQNIYTSNNKEQRFYPHATVCDPEGNVIVANSYGNVHVLSKSGKFLCYLLEEADLLECPLSIAFSSDGLLWVGCMDGKIIISKYIT